MVATIPLDELLAVDDPAWPRIKDLLARAAVAVDVLASDRPRSEQVLYRLQESAGTVLGGLALETGGILVDHGWLRLLGGVAAAGTPAPPDLASANGLDAGPDGAALPALAVAYDVLGGRFAINRGQLPGEPGRICYWGPDTLEWTPLGISHAAFVEWVTSGLLGQFYQDLRWEGWEEEVAAVPPGEGLACYPFLFSAEGREIEDTLRCPVPFHELLTLHDDLARQVGFLPSAPSIRPPRQRTTVR